MKAQLASVLLERANGLCECGSCNQGFDSSLAGTRTFDHALSRRVPDSLESIWVLRWGCHRAKTDNEPTAAHWWELFLQHQRKHGYPTEAAERKLAMALDKKALSGEAA